ncbi:MAG: DUF2620 domain-containing protein [Erysipelotrichaceae bacterium]
MKIVVGGQIDKQSIANKVKEILADQAIVEIKGDLEAVMAMQNGEFDYYLGACNTGGGGALAMAIALLGADKCATISMPGKIKSDEEIKTEVNDNKIAFGFTAQDIDRVVPVLLKFLQEK